MRLSVFSHWQFYVAMSRVMDLNNLSVRCEQIGSRRQMATTTTATANSRRNTRPRVSAAATESKDYTERDPSARAREANEEEVRETNQQAHGHAAGQTGRNKRRNRLEHCYRKLWRGRWERRAGQRPNPPGIRRGRHGADNYSMASRAQKAPFATLLQTEVIGLNAFLAKVGVPDV